MNLLDILTRAGSFAAVALIASFETLLLFPGESTGLAPIDLGLISALTPFCPYDALDPYGVVDPFGVDVPVLKDWDLMLACTGMCCAWFWARTIAVWFAAYISKSDQT
jgi:hypothetical protein